MVPFPAVPFLPSVPDVVEPSSLGVGNTLMRDRRSTSWVSDATTFPLGRGSPIKSSPSKSAADGQEPTEAEVDYAKMLELSRWVMDGCEE